jgi:UDP-N-acetylglucosamine 4-epimerase
VGCGERTTLLGLFDAIRRRVATLRRSALFSTLRLEAPRPGDVQHSLASIERARELLGYNPSHDLERGLDETIPWFGAQLLTAAQVPGMTNVLGAV